MAKVKTKVSTKGQIVIPGVFREEYGIRPGDTIFIKEEGGRLFLEKPMPIRNFLEEARKKHSRPGYTYSSAQYEKAMEGCN